jgi:hypothetical protein
MKFKSFVQNHSSSSLTWSNISKIIFLTLLIIVGIPISVHAAKVTNFIPKESILYAQLNDIDEIYNEINISKDWEKALELLIDGSELEEMQQGIMAVQNIIGTDLFSVIDTVGYQTGFAMWQREVGDPHGGFVVHSGGNLAEMQRLVKILVGFMGMSGGRLTLDAGKHRKVKYNTLQMPDVLLTYGFVGDFLVVGIGENSFEKLIDTYRKKSESILKNESYTEVSKNIGSAQVSLYLDLRRIIPFVEDMDVDVRIQLEAFSKVGAGLNLLETGPMFQLFTKFDPNFPESQVSRPLKEGKELATLSGISGDEELFIAFAPGILETMWELAREAIQNSDTDEAYTFISYLEGLSNLDFEEDVIAGLTGEIALFVDDLTQFDPNGLENLDIELDNTFRIDASNVHTHGGLIFNSSAPSKWDQVENSLSNLQNTSVSKMDYKGTNISVFASNIYYAERDGLSLLSFSEDQMYSMVDGLENKKKLSYLKQLPKTPLAVVKLNIVKLLELIDSSMQIEDDVVMSDEISPLLAWITVEKDKAMLEVSLSDKESPLEVLGKLAPFIASHLKNQEN